MRWLYSLRFLLRPFRSLRRTQTELEDEFDFHLEMETQKHMQRGLSPQEARREAMLSFGGVERFKEEVRDVDGIGWMERTITDIKYGLRMLRKNLVFTAVAVFTLALGIGGSTSIFSVVDGMMLRPLPYADADELVSVWSDQSRRGGPVREWLNYPNFRDLQRLDRVFAEVALYNDFFPTLTGRGEARAVTASVVTEGLFNRVLRVEPARGRAFTAEDDQPNAPRVVMLSHGFWTRQFGQDADIIGEALSLNGDPYTVIGIMPQGFRQPFLEQADLWTPLQWNDAEHGGSRGSAIVRSIGRLAAGVTLETARTEADALGRRLEEAYPDSNANVGYALFPLQADMVQGAEAALWVLLGSVGLVLLLVCVNLANLLLARGTGRRAELAVRAALGAKRGRIIGQLLTESVLLAIIGGALGVALSYVGTDLLVAMAPAGAPRIHEVAVDGRVLTFAIVSTLMAGVVFGLLPSLRASRTDLRDSLTEGGRGGNAGRSGRDMRRWLVSGQIALAVVLLIGSGLLLRTFNALRAVDLGFEPSGVVTMQVNLPISNYSDADAVRAFIEDLELRLSAVPGVTAVGTTNSLPLGGLDGDTDFNIEGRPIPEPGRENVAWIRRVSPDYFDAIGMRLVEGRGFTDADQMESERVVVINETLARRHFGDEEAVGQRINVNDQANTTWRRVVGVAHDVRNFGLRGDTPNAIYFPFAQLSARFVTAVVRTDGDPAALVAPLRAEASALDPSMALSLVPMESVVDGALAQDRFVTLLLLLFAGVALALAAIGLYGVVSYDIGRRMHEMGVRVALGANGSQIGRLVVNSSLAVAGIGIVVGVVAAVLLTRVMVGLLYGVSPTDPLTFAIVIVTLGSVALLASTLPAMKAAKVDPVTILKAD